MSRSRHIRIQDSGFRIRRSAFEKTWYSPAAANCCVHPVHPCFSFRPFTVPDSLLRKFRFSFRHGRRPSSHCQSPQPRGLSTSHFPLCHSDQTQVRCSRGRSSLVAVLERPAQRTQTLRSPSPRAAKQGRLPAHLHRRTGGGGLPRRRLVSFLHARKSRTHHPRAPHRRQSGCRARHLSLSSIHARPRHHRNR